MSCFAGLGTSGKPKAHCAFRLRESGSTRVDGPRVLTVNGSVDGGTGYTHMSATGVDATEINQSHSGSPVVSSHDTGTGTGTSVCDTFLYTYLDFICTRSVLVTVSLTHWRQSLDVCLFGLARTVSLP